MQLLISHPVGKRFVLLFLSTFICIVHFAENTFLLNADAVTIKNVSGIRNRDRTINLSWQVENEFSVKNYEIQHSSDGISFTDIETILPEGDATGKLVYERIHLDIINGDNYYRIRAIDLNGRSQYSSIVKVGLIKKATVSIYPNPVRNNTMHIKFEDQTPGIYRIRLINKMGQLVFSNDLELFSTNVVQAIRLTQKIAPGNYQITITSATAAFVQQLIVE